MSMQFRRWPKRRRGRAHERLSSSSVRPACPRARTNLRRRRARHLHHPSSAPGAGPARASGAAARSTRAAPWPPPSAARRRCAAGRPPASTHRSRRGPSRPPSTISRPTPSRRQSLPASVRWPGASARPPALRYSRCLPPPANRMSTPRFGSGVAPRGLRPSTRLSGRPWWALSWCLQTGACLAAPPKPAQQPPQLPWERSVRRPWRWRRRCVRVARATSHLCSHPPPTHGGLGT
mmetsp:Transcript_72555/g.208287  ORF Transcript_72555/g.208287 Transcript_72555/m.208287 type:complete len:235 (-) Transcript_72555:255-959(-)